MATRRPRASMVSIMTALWFETAAPGRPGVGQAARLPGAACDQLSARRTRRAVPDHAARVRWPAVVPQPQSKDPDPVDYSTGSVGIGATAPIWGAMARRYIGGGVDNDGSGNPSSGDPGTGRQYSLVGDAELDEGAVWEAILDPAVAELGEIVWIVDLNRQSLDRVVPNIAASRLEEMFAAAGWQVITVKLGTPARSAVHPARRRRRCAPASWTCPTPNTSGCCDAPPTQVRDRLPGDGPRGGRDRRADRRPRRRHPPRRDPQPRRPRPRRPDAPRTRRSTTPGRR